MAKKRTKPKRPYGGGRDISHVLKEMTFEERVAALIYVALVRSGKLTTGRRAKPGKHCDDRRSPD